MSLPNEPTQWTVTLAPAAPAPAAPTLRTKARRWGLTALAFLCAYWLGAASGDATPTAPPAPARTIPATITVTPHR
ncbi:hypothetical protein ACFC8F_23080 [Streptomyces hydrogenans]|uniref:hypothetical protein n=1 Tax=Streptomyces hydrogenans TaxID=1873719 RepID=UPI0035DB7752